MLRLSEPRRAKTPSEGVSPAELVALKLSRCIGFFDSSVSFVQGGDKRRHIWSDHVGSVGRVKTRALFRFRLGARTPRGGAIVSVQHWSLRKV
ncbi:hypothetical protein MRX96_002786 [Rhipicephalus microplus]